MKIKHVLRGVISLVGLTFWMLSCQSMAVEGHRVELFVADKVDSESYLAYHYGNRQYIQDTTYIDANGFAVFEGAEKLTRGLYLIVFDDDNSFEVIIDDNQHFSVHVMAEDIMGSIRFESSPDNDIFYNYLHFLTGKNLERREMDEELRAPGITRDRQLLLQNRFQEMDSLVREKQDQIIRDNPDGLLALILRGQRDPELPELPLLPDGSQDTDAMYKIYKSEFFENIDFSDSRILYSPVYHNRLRVYFNNVLIQNPDTIIKEADRILEKARANDDFFRYTIWFLANNAETSQIMGMDKVFVYLIDNYYATGDVYWIDEERRQRLVQRAANMRRLLIGKTAPDISIFDTEDRPVSLHAVDAEYLILYFWDSECAFCRQAAPLLKEAYRNLRDEGVQIFAINTETNKNRWLNALKDYPDTWVHGQDVTNRSGFRDIYNIFAIPQIFILNKEKQILAKDIGPEHVERFIRQEMRSK
ncbi:MAG: DUF5106 domain-containing protein [Bacteroidia bacterium]|nr:MAG: DUF5106 domain-containing protein [Bacteroidia bacterium]